MMYHLPVRQLMNINLRYSICRVVAWDQSPLKQNRLSIKENFPSGMVAKRRPFYPPKHFIFSLNYFAVTTVLIFRLLVAQKM